jgi:N-carbamoylputrescine amidase
VRQVTVAATQISCSEQLDRNIQTAEAMVRDCAAKGANIILLQELFETLYFCQVEDAAYFSWATTPEANRAIAHFQPIAKELAVVLPISFFEKCNQAYYNSIAVIDADGAILGTYRKTHIPDGPGYEEKFYFNPGDTGFQVWRTRFATIGVGICWDQWFPETARCMALMGADVLFFPTAIGSEPGNPAYDSQPHWQTCMQGHAAANMLPVVASNRIGAETIADHSQTFYGSSFITDNRGQILKQLDRTRPGSISAAFDLDALEMQRRGWGLFRDRRPRHYRTMLTADGKRADMVALAQSPFNIPKPPL